MVEKIFYELKNKQKICVINTYLFDKAKIGSFVRKNKTSETERILGSIESSVLCKNIYNLKKKHKYIFFDGYEKLYTLKSLYDIPFYDEVVAFYHDTENQRIYSEKWNF